MSDAPTPDDETTSGDAGPRSEADDTSESDAGPTGGEGVQTAQPDLAHDDGDTEDDSDQ